MARPNTHHNARKAELLDIAERLFLENGYEQTTLEELLLAAGISKGAFYHYFKTKEDALHGSIDRLIDRSVALLLPVVEDPALPALDKLNCFILEKNRFQGGKRDYAKLLAALMQSDAARHRYVLASSRKLVPLFAAILAQGVEEQVFAVPYPGETAELLIRAVVSVPAGHADEPHTASPEEKRRYRMALKHIVAGALGISPDAFADL